VSADWNEAGSRREIPPLIGMAMGEIIGNLNDVMSRHENWARHYELTRDSQRGKFGSSGFSRDSSAYRPPILERNTEW
jgi:hypothetical protein